MLNSGLFLDNIDKQTESLRETLCGARLFITGGTGFFGRWLLEYLAYCEDLHNLGLRATVLTRDRNSFARAHKNVDRLLSHRALHFMEGDVRDFAFPAGSYSHVIHGAHTTARATFNGEDPLVQFDTACSGARLVLDFALQAGACRFLMLSSGSVYGPPPADLARIPEDFSGAPLPQDVGAALNHGKRAAEFQCACYHHCHGLETVVARCFSFIGPGLPLDIHYAVGNFIRDALWGDEIVVSGDGSPVRSYMHIADLLVWLLTMLIRAPSGSVYNVGSDVSISILELATRVRDLLAPGKPVSVRGRQCPNTSRNVYVPDISKAREMLGLDIWTSLDTSILETARYASACHDPFTVSESTRGSGR